MAPSLLFLEPGGRKDGMPLILNNLPVFTQTWSSRLRAGLLWRTDFPQAAHKLAEGFMT